MAIYTNIFFYTAKARKHKKKTKTDAEITSLKKNELNK